MKTNNLKRLAVAATALAAALVAAEHAQASGFEKSITWGGRSAGLAGIATPYIQGSDALFFNPAGLAGDKVGNSAAVNLSPTSTQFKGPINNANTQDSSERKTVVPFGLTYGRTMNDKFGFGAGVFVSGGAQANFNEVDFSAATGYLSEVKTDLRILEMSAGAGYKVSDDFKLGLAWRVVMAQADFSFVKRSGSPTASSFVNAKLSDLKDTQVLAFKLGAQHKLNEKTDLGLSFRSEVNFKATGRISGRVVSPGTTSGAANPAVNEADATARTTFPMAVTLGMFHKCNEDWNMLGEYAWTQYSRIGEISLESGSTTTGLSQTSVKTDWRDQHNVRLAAEYLPMAWPVRFGYGFTSTVTNPDYARASFTPPGPAHTLTVGTGKAFNVNDRELRFDGALEYTTTSGDVDGKAGAGTSSAGADTRNGSYSATAMGLHLALSYDF